jgi:hypothetical protein
MIRPRPSTSKFFPVYHSIYNVPFDDALATGRKYSPKRTFMWYQEREVDGAASVNVIFDFDLVTHNVGEDVRWQSERCSFCQVTHNVGEDCKMAVRTLFVLPSTAL